MKRTVVGFALVSVLAFTGCGGRERHDGGGEVIVFAAASLTESFRALAEAFDATASGTKTTLVFAGSHTLATQLVEGARADVFVSADRHQMERVEALAEAPVPFATNRLVILAPKENPARITTPADLAAPGVCVVLAHPDCPAGAYGRHLLGALGLREAVEANVVSREETVKGVVGKVLLGEADGGIVYATDVTPEIARETVTIEFPSAGADRPVYHAAPLRDAPNRAGADAFVRFLLSGAGGEILASFGFGAP